jgi:hypothetical protein
MEKMTKKYLKFTVIKKALCNNPLIYLIENNKDSLEFEEDADVRVYDIVHSEEDIIKAKDIMPEHRIVMDDGEEFTVLDIERFDKEIFGPVKYYIEDMKEYSEFPDEYETEPILKATRYRLIRVAKKEGKAALAEIIGYSHCSKGFDELLKLLGPEHISQCCGTCGNNGVSCNGCLNDSNYVARKKGKK